MSGLALLADLLIYGFVLSTPLQLLAYLLLAARRSTLAELIACSHTLLLIGACISLILAFISLGQLLSLSWQPGQEEARYWLLNRLFGPYWFAYWGGLLGKGVLPQLLWLKSRRQSVWTAAMLLPFLLADFYLPARSYFPRDYLPSNWLMLPQINYLALVQLPAAYLAALLLMRRLTGRHRAA